MKSKRVILDTNLWISFLISKNFRTLDSLISNGKILLLFSNESLEEFADVVERPKFKKYFSQKDVQYILDAFSQFGELVDIKSNISICRDEKDNFLLDLSVDGKADYLITGDKDLLVLSKIEKTEIITISSFLEKVSL